jgi:Myb-like DNA-binding domain
MQRRRFTNTLLKKTHQADTASYIEEWILAGIAAAEVAGARRAMKMPRRWTPEEDRKLLALRATGVKWSVVARNLGRTEPSVIGRVVVSRKRKREGFRASLRRLPRPAS